MSNHHVEINPETLWREKLRFWPSAVLAELAIRIQAILKERAARYGKEANTDQ